MNKSPLLSLCIPTNGVTQWVKPVLESIYNQNVDEDLYEVVLTDDGDNAEFKSFIKEYKKNHKNLYYYETSAECFLNEIACYKKAKGTFLKFVNHRNVLRKGTINYFIDFVNKNINDKPIVYFANGAVPGEGDVYSYNTFDEFVKCLGVYSSWSSGMAIWKKDLDEFKKPLEEYNVLFPHTDILFNDRNRDKYIVDNTVFFDEIDSKKTPKGEYDFFYAFGIEYPSIILNLLKSKDISYKTFKYVKDRNLEFIGKWYMIYVVFGRYTAHDISGAKNIFGVFYTKPQMYWAILRKSIWKLNKEIRKKLGLKV